MKLLNFNQVLCISPHPDDVEYSMLGSIIKYTDTQFHLFQVSQGGDCDESTGHHRLEEVSNVWKTAGVNNIKFQFTPHKFVKELEEEHWINLIEQYINKYNFDAIFLPNEADSHFEHRFISGFGPALIRNKKISLIQYYTPSTQDAWNPNLYIDIESEYNLKLKSLNMFKSQNQRYYFREDVLRAFHSDFQCSKKGVHHIEKYKVLNLFV
jgi:LmbE family N-acetylglucosaminyl deacetylase